MTLFEGDINQEYRIDQVEVEGNVGRRLQSLGLIHDTFIKVVNKKKNGAIIFKARGTRLAVGKDIAKKILVCTKEC
ncbi:FeoA family protein [Anaerosporobacter faecicola]|uniref:FeoA family protein n=1 Tax=Anaerosporobacter faecicola TaxID=2718714 RepID=UPI00143C19E5|nr:FeoA domain-containing protein [Anaerosporobacter faecicola]